MKAFLCRLFGHAWGYWSYYSGLSRQWGLPARATPWESGETRVCQRCLESQYRNVTYQRPAEEFPNVGDALWEWSE